MTRHLFRPGDWLMLAAGASLVVWLFATQWSRAAADKVIIRAGGKLFAEATLTRNQTIQVPGPLGTSVIRIENRRARIASDPSPRQYCVRQGWLARQGETSICLPNEVSIELAGSRKLYDSLNY